MIHLLALTVWTPIVSFLLQLPPSPAPSTEQAPNYSQEAAVVEQSRSTYRFEKDGTGTRKRYMRVKVQSDAGVQAWGQLVLGFNSANEKLEIDFVRVRKGDGTVVTAPLDAVQDMTSPIERDAPVYTDFRPRPSASGTASSSRAPGGCIRTCADSSLIFRTTAASNQPPTAGASASSLQG